MASTAALIVDHILSERRAQSHRRPLFVAIQGPQGSGKSYTTAKLYDALVASPYNLKVATLSIDDFYLPHSGLRALAHDHPDNVLWRGRGPPGTHDIELALQLLGKLKEGSPSDRVELPRFDKSLHGGEGDRLPIDGSGPQVITPVDIVILEGWFVGFRAVSSEALDQIWDSTWREEQQNLKLEFEGGELRQGHISAINELLHEYEKIWDFFDVFVQIKPASSLGLPSQYSVIYTWRLQQEHSMKALNGGKGMSDEAVKRFVDRYIPGYVFFGAGIFSPSSRWINHGLAVHINERREVVRLERF